MNADRTCCVFGEAAKQNAAEVACSDCGLDPMCLVLDYAESHSGVPQGVLFRRKPVAAGEVLFRGGQSFDALYAVKSGSLKAELAHEHSGNRVVGFYFAGELIGTEGLSAQTYATTVRALEASQVCVLHISRLEQSGRPQQVIQSALIEMLSQEVVLNQRVMAQLMRQSSEQRLAAFLVVLSERLSGRGFSPELLNLRMSRSDIGSYLGLARETVSRLFTRFQRLGLIRLRHNQLQILDAGVLRAIAFND